MTDSDITLYAHRFRSRAERVLWTLNESGLPFAVRRLDAEAGDLASPTFRALNPGGKIPVLTHGTRVLTESVPICEYVARLAPAKRLLPSTDDEHYDYARVMHFMLTEIEAYLWVSDQASRLVDYYPWPDGSAAFAQQLATKNLSALKYLVGDEFACCGRFTVADILLATLVVWARASHIEVPPPLIDHARRMQHREGCPDNLRARD